MWQRLLLGLFLAVSAYYVVKYFSQEGFTNWDSVIETPAIAYPPRELKERGDLRVASGGPNPPNAAPPSNMPSTMSPSPVASDPYDETAEASNAPEKLRFPDRSFSPGVVPEQTNIAEQSGLAGAVQQSSQAFQQFSPEYVQNGGAFYGEVGAYEDENPNYTAF